jgi:hypothetical protein
MIVISFSVFGADSKYREGLVKNVTAATIVYPDWQLFVYCDRENHDVLRAVASERIKVICQKELSEGLEGALWRYLPALDPRVETVIFRDADSLVGAREAEAVDEWLSSPFQVHLIRDHPYHESPVMGGMFGVRGAAVQTLASLLGSALARRRLHLYGDDQAFLNEEFYPRLRHTALVHTDFLRYFFEHTRPLRPPADGEDFIGAYANLTRQEQEKYLIMRDQATPKTLPPPNWADIAIWRRVHHRVVFKRIAHRCRWCV